MDIQKISIDKIKHAKYNPRKNLKPGDVEYEKLKRSIEKFGYVEPVIWNSCTGNIVGGHQRFKVLVQLGAKEVDCVVVDMDEQKEKALNVALNKVSGDWDMPLLTDLLKDLDTSGFDVSLTGFDLSEINELFGEPDTKEDDFDADKALDEIETPISTRGDVWLLGKHRLICGDSTAIDDVTALMNGQEADLVLTDPPYNVDYEGGTDKKLKIQNDKMKDTQFLQFLTDAFTRMYEHSKKGAAIYVFHADSEGYNFRNAFKLAGYRLRQCLVWVKSSLVMGKQDYQWQHEPILYGWKDGAGHAWYGDRKQTTLVKFDKPHRNGEHPTMKPVGLCGYFIANSSKEGDKAIKSDLSVDLAEAVLYADDGVATVVKEFKSGKLSLGVDDIGRTAAEDLTGATIDDNGVLVSTSEDGGTPVAIGFRAKKANGKYRYFWLYKVKFGIPATNLETKGDSIKFSTPSIEGTVMRRNKLDGQGNHPWKSEVSEDDAGVVAATITGWFTQVYEPEFTVTP